MTLMRGFMLFFLVLAMSVRDEVPH